MPSITMDQPATTQACDNDSDKIPRTPFRLTCFTVFDMTTDMTKLADNFQYMAYGKEVCPKTKKDHYQAFAYSKTAQRWSWWQKLLAPNHFEKCRGTLDENEKYCSKSGIYTEHGTKPMQNGKRRDLAEIAADIKLAATTGKRFSEVTTMEQHATAAICFRNGLKGLYNDHLSEKQRKTDKDFAPEVIYIYGPPGSGKTRHVRDLEPAIYDCPEDDMYKWKDGYSGEDAVLYDNVRTDNIKPTRMLKEIDRYFIQVPVKGGYIGWRPKRIYITSIHPLDVFANESGFTDAREFTRRVTQTIVKN